ncbi:hypothetical protein PanWU01x14_370250 [Parasponia andersonii]|uniref:Uncharacterized protein n=1 Tax=Parasponia andersonii TaxID=3476 RepID=A0A2P5A4H9_PARAD|nr:hypothetical protein PanWU01x14_370250 [Parasponia andersonii]
MHNKNLGTKSKNEIPSSSTAVKYAQFQTTKEGSSPANAKAKPNEGKSPQARQRRKPSNPAKAKALRTRKGKSPQPSEGKSPLPSEGKSPQVATADVSRNKPWKLSSSTMLIQDQTINLRNFPSKMISKTLERKLTKQTTDNGECEGLVHL